jgi:enoyl-CoA hydratase/carnithine racemase
VSEVLVETRGSALWLTINRPERRNALSSEVLATLIDELVSVDPAEVRSVVLTGAGEIAFCAGADLAATAPDATGHEQHEARGTLRELFSAMQDCPVPVIARVRGLCLAGGIGVALGADLLVASDDAKFGLPEVNIGLWPYMVGALVTRHVSPKRALDWILTARRLDAAEAYDWGLVSRVVPVDRLDAEVEEICARVAGLSPLVLRLGKAAWYDTADAPLWDALRYLHTQLSLTAQTKDAVEGVTAFLQKRDPEWTGR